MHKSLPSKVSVIIPTYNRMGELKQVLPSYIKDKKVSEIVIVNDCCTDKTDTMIKQNFLNEKKITYVLNRTNKGAPESRNIGVKKAKFDLVFFGEDDLELTPNFMGKLLNHMSKSNADIIAGRRIWMQGDETKKEALLRTEKKSGYPINSKLIISDFQLNFSNDIELPLLDASMLLKRNVFNNITYDKELIITAWREETDFQFSAAEKGYKLIFCPHVFSLHLSKKKNNGGNHSHAPVLYEFNILKNNYYFFNKHKKFIRDKFNIQNVYFYELRFAMHRVFEKNLFPTLLRKKKNIINFVLSRS